MRFIIGVLFGGFIASFWFLSFFVAFEPYFVIPAGLSSGIFLITLAVTIMANWDIWT